MTEINHGIQVPGSLMKMRMELYGIREKLKHDLIIVMQEIVMIIVVRAVVMM